MSERIVGRCYFCNKNLLVITEVYKVRDKVRRGKEKDVPKVTERTSIKQNFMMVVEQQVFRKVCLSCNGELKGINHIYELIDIL